MTPDEQAVRAAATRFYEGIEEMNAGRGIHLITEAWHHDSDVTSSHPNGDWASGWEEILATWTVFASFGHPDRGGTQMRNLQVHIYGDVAYTTCVFVCPPALGADALNCTNVFRRVGGQWKLIHHHPDKSVVLAAALEKIASRG